MHPLVLLEPLSYLQPGPGLAYRDTPAGLEYHGQAGALRFDKATGRLALNPPGLDVLQLLQELQALVSAQEAQERARMLQRLAQRPY